MAALDTATTTSLQYVDAAGKGRQLGTGDSLDLNLTAIILETTGSGDVTLHSDNEIVMHLGDDAGIDFLRLKDSVGADVFTVDSNGNAICNNLSVLGTKTINNTESVNVADNHMYLNAGYTTAAAQTGGLVVNYLPTATVDSTAGAGVFTAGVDTTSDPNVTTAAAAVFSAGDLIQLSGSANGGENDGLYEVVSHAANVLTVRSTADGVTNQVEDFTDGQFTANAGDTGVSITKVTVSVLRAGTDGTWETASGSTTGLSFNNLLDASSGLTHSLDDAYDDGSSVTVDTAAVAWASSLVGNAMEITTSAVAQTGAALDINLSGAAMSATPEGLRVEYSGSINSASDAYGINLIGVTNATGDSVGININAGWDVGIETLSSIDFLDNVAARFGTNTDWTILYDETTHDALEIAGATSAATVAGTDLKFDGSAGGVSATATAGGAGGSFLWTAGTGGAAADVATGGAGTGGAITLTSGAGGAGIDATNDYAGGVGGALTITAGIGGAGAGAVTNGGVGGALLLQGGDGGAAGLAQGVGGSVSIQGGQGSTDGAIDIGTAESGEITIGGAQATAVNVSTNTDYLTAILDLANTTQTVGIFAGAVTPNGAVTGLAGSIYLRDTATSGEVYVNTSTGSGTTWTQLASAGGSSLQSSYEAGNSITVSTAEGVFSVIGTVDDAQTVMSITGGAHTVSTAENLLSISNDADSTGYVLQINNLGTGNALDVQDAGTSVLTVTGAGAATVSSVSGQNLTLSSSGVGITDIDGGIGITMDTGGASGITLDSTAGPISLDASGAVNLTSSGSTVDVDSSGALSINSSAGAINIGNDAVAQNINIGTGAAARTITVGNVTGATATNLNSGTGGVTLTATSSDVSFVGTDIHLDASGEIITNSNLQSATAISLGQALYVDSSGDLAIADASAEATAEVVGFAASAHGAGAEQVELAAIPGTVILLASTVNLVTLGGMCYLSETGGAVTQTAPTTSGAVVYEVGICVATGAATSKILYKPNYITTRA